MELSLCGENGAVSCHMAPKSEEISYDESTSCDKSTAVKASKRTRRLSAVPDDVYDALLKLATGRSLQPVKERTRAEKTAIIRYWRAKGKIAWGQEDGKDLLFFEGIRILRISEIKDAVEKKVRRCRWKNIAVSCQTASKSEDFSSVESTSCDKGTTAKTSRGTRKLSAVPDDVYDALLKLATGKSLQPVRERTRAEKTAIIRYWRAEGKITWGQEDGKDVLYFEGRRILRISEIKDVVEEEVKGRRKKGARRLLHSLRERYVGISSAKIQHILNDAKNATM